MSRKSGAGFALATVSVDFGPGDRVRCIASILVLFLFVVFKFCGKEEIFVVPLEIRLCVRFAHLARSSCGVMLCIRCQ